MNTSHLSASTNWYRLLLVGVLSLFIAVPALAQDRMPLTSSSETAREAVLDAIDHAFNVQLVAARAAADRALDADPEFEVAIAKDVKHTKMTFVQSVDKRPGIRRRSD
ncbi:MAG: hypothetical protein GVY25_08765 [Bacteroidetes bacterium]|jgi:hypothetical protein|nr:hypothetical protein [Bacteroidota bacterium]